MLFIWNSNLIGSPVFYLATLSQKFICNLHGQSWSNLKHSGFPLSHQLGARSGTDLIICPVLMRKRNQAHIVPPKSDTVSTHAHTTTWSGTECRTGFLTFSPRHRDLGSIFRKRKRSMLGLFFVCLFYFSSNHIFNFCHITFSSHHT